MSSPLAAIKAVLAGFFGVQSRRNAEKTPIKPIYFIVAGVMCAVILALLIISLAQYLVAHGGGQ
jgi:hypothetical protein